MAISIIDYNLSNNTHIPNNTHIHYDVHFFSYRIDTLVTSDPKLVADWLSDTERILSRRLTHPIVGLDVEWRPDPYKRNRVAILQLCVDRRCLIFQILHCQETYNNEVPRKLHEFLAEEEYTFVGVGIGSDVKKLEKDYGIRVGGKTLDLRQLAAEEYDTEDLKRAGLRRLAKVVLRKDVEKPKSVAIGRWDDLWLNPNQVRYACIDAFVSFEIGRRLLPSSFTWHFGIHFLALLLYVFKILVLFVFFHICLKARKFSN